MTAFSPPASVLGLEPGWLYPSISTACVIAGNADCGAIVNGPVPAMLKSIVSTAFDLSALT